MIMYMGVALCLCLRGMGCPKHTDALLVATDHWFMVMANGLSWPHNGHGKVVPSPSPRQFHIIWGYLWRNYISETSRAKFQLTWVSSNLPTHDTYHVDMSTSSPKICFRHLQWSGSFIDTQHFRFWPTGEIQHMRTCSWGVAESKQSKMWTYLHNRYFPQNANLCAKVWPL